MDGRGFSGRKVSMSMNGGCVTLTFQASNRRNSIDWASPIGDIATGLQKSSAFTRGLRTILHGAPCRRRTYSRPVRASEIYYSRRDVFSRFVGLWQRAIFLWASKDVHE